MKKLSSYFLLFTLIFGLALTGCNKEEGNPVGNGDGNGDGNNGGGSHTIIPQIPEVSGAANVLLITRVTVNQSGFEISQGVGAANLNGQDKGTVTATVQGTDYTFAKSTNNGTVSYFFPNPDTPTEFMTLPSGTADVTFNVSNYALGQSTVVVPGNITLTAPAANSTIPRSNALTVSWNANASGDNSAIFIVDADGNTKFKPVGSGANSGEFTASEMGSLVAGDAFVYALSFNYVLTNNNEAVLIGEAVAFNQVTLE